MKHLGIDYGSKRIGLALSDDNGRLAFPKETINNSQDIIQDIKDVVEYESVEKIVVGKSLDPWGSENLIQREIDTFIKKLKYDISEIDIVYQDERGSSIAAASHLYGKDNIANPKWTTKANMKKREHNDANAAAVILQRYLDKQKNQT
ncbi:MAG: Holliday junction resolvase RuvX [Candidatus Pacebacteria bacterium]|nr:Holliday junction resolvase RuvX [Candidatus Paceibacterota bacterium]